MTTKYRFSDYKRHYKHTLLLSAPIVMSQVGSVTVQLVDNAMVGRLGKVELAAVSLSGSIFFMVFILVMGVCMGLTPLVGERYVQGKHRESAKYLQNSIVLNLFLGVVAYTIMRLGVPLIYHMGQPQEVVDMAIPYFKYLALSIIPFTLFAAFKQFLEGIGRPTMNMMVIIVSNVVNIVGNYMFIYGNWGAPQMGVEGAGLAVIITRMSMPILLIGYFVSKPDLRRYLKFFSYSNFKKKYNIKLFAIGFPISLQMFMEGSIFALTAIMMGWIGTVQIGADQIANVVSNFAFMIIIGVGAATTIRVSHEYGQKNLRELKKVATSSYHIGLLWNTVTAVLFIIFREDIPRIFTTDPDVIKLAAQLMIFVAAFQFSDGLQMISIGILRGMQDVRSILPIAFLSYYVVALPFGYFCAFTLGLGAVGLWISFIVGLTIAAILLMRRYRKKYAQLRSEQMGH